MRDNQHIGMTPWYSLYYWQGPRRLLLSAQEMASAPARRLLRQFYGGLSSRVFERYRRHAWALPGHPGRTLIALLERRLDVVLMRSQWYTSIYAARQAIHHGRIRVNHRVVTLPSSNVHPGDVIHVDQKVSERMGSTSTKMSERTYGDHALRWHHLRYLVKLLGKKAFRRSFLRGFQNPWGVTAFPILYTMTAYPRSRGMVLDHTRLLYACASFFQMQHAPMTERAPMERLPVSLEYAPSLQSGMYVGTPSVVWYPFMIDVDTL